MGTCTDRMPCVHSCDWNRYSIQYALAVSRQRGTKRTREAPGLEDAEMSDEDTETSDEDSLHLLGGAEDRGEDMMLT